MDHGNTGQASGGGGSSTGGAGMAGMAGMQSMSHDMEQCICPFHDHLRSPPQTP